MTIKAGEPFRCGHARDEANSLVFKNASSPGGKAARCRQCHNRKQLTNGRVGRGALKLVIALHVDGTLSEGQVSAATGLDRIAIRELVDAA